MYRNKHPPSVILATYLRKSFLPFSDAVFGHFLLAWFPAPEHYDIIDEFTEFSFPWNSSMLAINQSAIQVIHSLTIVQ